MLRALGALVLAAAVLAPAPTPAQTPVEQARALVARYHEDLTRIDRAREVLAQALARDRQVETMVWLSYLHFLWGDVRAKTEDEKLEAYAQGREIAKRAVELAPNSHDAHLWYAINTGRWGETKGVLRSLFLLPTMWEELEILFRLDPKSVRAHSLAGNVYFKVPGLFGGDRAKAEEHFRKGLAIDPRFTVLRVDLARLLIARGRHDEARRELEQVINEREPRHLADWTVKDRPRARELLESLRGR